MTDSEVVPAQHRYRLDEFDDNGVSPSTLPCAMMRASRRRRSYVFLMKNLRVQFIASGKSGRRDTYLSECHVNISEQVYAPNKRLQG